MDHNIYIIKRTFFNRVVTGLINILFIVVIKCCVLTYLESVPLCDLHGMFRIIVIDTIYENKSEYKLMEDFNINQDR